MYWRNGCAPGHRTGRQPATRSARRASRSLHLSALAAPHPPCSSPRPSPTLRSFLAPASCSQGPKRPPGPACGLPAAAGLAACCRSLCCAAGAACLLGACCSGRTPARGLFSLAAPRTTRTQHTVHRALRSRPTIYDRSKSCLCPRAARAAAGPGRGNSLAVTDWYRGNSLAVTDWYRGNSLAVTDWYSRHPGPPWTTLRP
jgi:hypothetical protein